MYLTASLAANPGTDMARQFRAMAQTAERGGLDAVWLGHGPVAAGPDPLPLLGSLIALTQRIGLGAAWSTDHAEPFHVARVFATLDHLSAGRTAWLFGQPDDPALFAHVPERTAADAERRATELIGVVLQLWDSWEDEAFLVDVPSGRFADPARVHPIHHDGEHFSVRGPLNVPRPPQGNPVLVQVLTSGALPHSSAEILLADPAQAAAIAPDRYRRVLVNVAAGQCGGLTAQAADWLAQGLCDGVNVVVCGLDEMARFVDEGVPPLRAAGLRQAAPAGTTQAFLLRVGQPPKPELIKRLPDGSTLVEVCLGQEPAQALGVKTVRVREVRGRVRRPGGGWSEVRLWTSLLDGESPSRLGTAGSLCPALGTGTRLP